LTDVEREELTSLLASLKVAGVHDILVVEVKAEGDDSNRNRAKCLNGLKHFETFNERLNDVGEKWLYHLYILSPGNYTSFFEQVRRGATRVGGRG
jgi:hypothetical protein